MHKLSCNTEVAFTKKTATLIEINCQTLTRERDEDVTLTVTLTVLTIFMNHGVAVSNRHVNQSLGLFYVEISTIKDNFTTKTVAPSSQTSETLTF